MKVTAKPIVSGPLSAITKGLMKRPENLDIRGREETIHY